MKMWSLLQIYPNFDVQKGKGPDVQTLSVGLSLSF